jgi:hypothetical protein
MLEKDTKSDNTFLFLLKSGFGYKDFIKQRKMFLGAKLIIVMVRSFVWTIVVLS